MPTGGPHILLWRAASKKIWGSGTYGIYLIHWRETLIFHREEGFYNPGTAKESI